MATKKAANSKKATAKKPPAKKLAQKATSTDSMVKNDVAPVENTNMPAASNPSPRTSAQTFNLVVAALVLAVLAMGYVRFKYFLVPAMVNNSPIYSWQYIKALNQSAGKQVLDQLVVEKLISQEADAQNITLTQEEIDAEIKRLDEQFASVGGLDAFLASQGLKREDIQNQLELNLKVQKIVAGKVNVTQEEVDKYYSDNQADYAEQPQEEAKVEIRKMLVDQATQQQISTLIQDLRAKAQVTINLPGTTTN